MTDHEKRASERVPVALRIRLRYHAVDQFISKFAVNISRGGMFLSSRNPKPPGTELYFEIRLADESPIIEGSGEVRWIREYDRRRPDDPHGMGIEFLELSEESWPVLDRIIEHRRHIGEHDDNSIPEPRAAERGRNPIDTSDPGYSPRDAEASRWPGRDSRNGQESAHRDPEPPRDGHESSPGRPLPIGSIDAPLEEAPPSRGNGSDRASTDEDLRRELMRVLAPAVLLTSRQRPEPSDAPEPDQDNSSPAEPDLESSRASSDGSNQAYGQESSLAEPDHHDASRYDSARHEDIRSDSARHEATPPDGQESSLAEPERQEASRAASDEPVPVSAQESRRPEARPDGRRLDAPRAQSIRPRASSRGVEPPVVRAAVARARALTSDVHVETELDRELAELLEESAVPVEITVEAASRELAERLGGAPVERRRARADHADRAETARMAHRAMSLDEALSDDVDPDDRPVRGHAPEPIAGESHAARLLRKS
jgi:uncharacterized protein (TIGR02266 family)